MVCARVNLDSVCMLVSRLGSGSGVGFCPFVVYPPSCWGSRFHTTEQFYGGVRLTGAVFPFLGVVFHHVSNILLLFDVCLSLIWLPAIVSLYIYIW